MFDPNANASPFNRIPFVVLAIFLIVVGLETLFQLGDRGIIGDANALNWRIEAIRVWGFNDPVFEYMRTTGTYNWETLHRFVTYPFFHFSFQHAIFGSLMFLAVGKGIADNFHPLAVITLFVIVSIMGALMVGLFGSHNRHLAGMFTPLYGFLGAIVWMLVYKPGLVRNGGRTALQIVGFLFVMQAILHFAVRGNDEWINRLTGFVTGFVLSFVLAPDGRARIRLWLDRMRQR